MMLQGPPSHHTVFWASFLPVAWRGGGQAAGLGSVPGHLGRGGGERRGVAGGCRGTFGWLDAAPSCPTPLPGGRRAGRRDVLEEGCRAGARGGPRVPLIAPGRGIEPGLECETLHPGTAPRRQVFGARGSSASAGGDVPPPIKCSAPGHPRPCLSLRAGAVVLWLSPSPPGPAAGQSLGRRSYTMFSAPGRGLWGGPGSCLLCSWASCSTGMLQSGHTFRTSSHLMRHLGEDTDNGEGVITRVLQTHHPAWCSVNPVRVAATPDPPPRWVMGHGLGGGHGLGQICCCAPWSTDAAEFLIHHLGACTWY